MVVTTVLLKNVNYKQTLKALDLKVLITLFFGLFISFTITSIYVDFETLFYNLIFLTFSIFKSFYCIYIFKTTKVIYKIIHLMSLSTFFSTGFGISWMFDFMIYFLLFSLILEKRIDFKNKDLLVFIFVISLSLLSPLMNTPALKCR